MFFVFFLASFSPLCFRSSGGPSFNRPSMCSHPDSHTCIFFSPAFVYLEMMHAAFSEYRCMYIYLVPFPLSHCMENTSYVLSFRMMVFPYLVTTGWIFYISLCENSTKINQYPYPFRRHSYLDDYSKGITGEDVSLLRQMRARAYNPRAWKGLGNTTNPTLNQELMFIPNRNTPINMQVLDNFYTMLTKALTTGLTKLS